jgi:DNA-directed RNA polymerase specialized sigma54-like protein
MAKLNITQAAQAVGKHRSTLQRHIKDGTLSVERDGTENPVIDVSELQRVYGHVDFAIDATAPQNGAVRQVDAPSATVKMQLLEAKLQAVERERDEAVRREQEEKERHRETRENRDRLLGVVEKQSKTIAMLPVATAAPPEGSVSGEPSKRGFWARFFRR